ncbi:MAG: cytidine deaminase [Fusobacteriia bacterium 4572_132]|nr:MAG: cytidine deaminase [Fusobacteriia bacterium 4572_132]
MGRPDWNEYFMEITELVATRATCVRRKVGAIIVRENRILATGYNGAPSGLAHCLDIGCLRDKMNIPSGERQELCRGIHAEQNALIQASKFGIALDGSTIYVTNQPCITCSKLIINAGIKKIIYKNPYPDKLALELLKEANIEVIIYEK